MNKQSQPIDLIRKQFHHEWLLIAIDEIDQSTSTVLTGNLIAHSPSQLEIYKIAKQHQGNLMTVYSEDWPEDIAAAFYVKISL